MVEIPLALPNSPITQIYHLIQKRYLHFKSLHSLPSKCTHYALLKETIQKYNSKLVIISDIAGFFLDKDISEVETQRIFSQVITFLSNFARESQTIIIATYPPHKASSRNNLLHKQTWSKANVVLSLSRSSYARKILLEKHPYLSTSAVELPDQSVTVADFAEANA